MSDARSEPYTEAVADPDASRSERGSVRAGTPNLVEDLTVAIRAEMQNHALRPILRLKQFNDVMSWAGPVDVSVRARALIGLLSVDSTQEMTAACAEAIAASDDWRTLLTDMVQHVEIQPYVMATAGAVLRHRQISHPLAGLSALPQHAIAVFDAFDNRRELRFKTHSWTLPDGPCLLLSLADIVGDYNQATMVQLGPETIVTVGDEPWLERHRFACPAFAVVVA